jgi:hypothetical protein
MSQFNDDKFTLKNAPLITTPNSGKTSLYVNDSKDVRVRFSDGTERSLLTTTGSSGATVADVVASQDVGAIEAGDTVLAGSTLQDFVEQLLVNTFFPTFTSPSFNLTSSLSSNVEAGTISNVTLTANFNRGLILGDLVGGIWDAGATQDFRAGAATNYIIDGVDNDLDNDLVVNSYQVEDNSNQWSANVQYAIGPQPLDSNGDNYDSPLSSGSLNATVTVNGRRKAFYGTDSGATVAYTTSNEIRALSGDTLNPSNGTSFTINIPVGATMVVFAYPATLQDVDSVIYVEGLNAEVKNIFSQSIISVEGANSYTGINYKVYTYIPAVAFTDDATYVVTI